MMQRVAPLILALASTGAVAAPAAVDPAVMAVRSTVMKYANASGCASVVPKPKMVTRLVAPNHTDDDTFVVLLDVDHECHRAKDSWSTQIYVVERPAGNFASDDPQDLKVSPEMSAPIAQRKGGPRILTSIYSKDRQLYVTGADFKPSDAPCCPTLTSTFKIDIQRKTVTFAEDDHTTLYRWILEPVQK